MPLKPCSNKTVNLLSLAYALLFRLVIKTKKWVFFTTVIGTRYPVIPNYVITTSRISKKHKRFHAHSAIGTENWCLFNLSFRSILPMYLEVIEIVNRKRNRIYIYIYIYIVSIVGYFACTFSGITKLLVCTNDKFAKGLK